MPLRLFWPRVDAFGSLNAPWPLGAFADAVAEARSNWSGGSTAIRAETSLLQVPLRTTRIVTVASGAANLLRYAPRLPVILAFTC